MSVRFVASTVGIAVLVLLFGFLWMEYQNIGPSYPVNVIPNKLAKINSDQKLLLDLYQKEWEVTINTQMHLNTLGLTFRSAALTAFLTFLGAAATLGQAGRLNRTKRTMILVLPVIFWVAAFVMDLFYYYPLLLGAVAQASKFDRASSLSRLGLFGLTTAITQQVSLTWSKRVLLAYYLIPFVAAVIFVGAIGASEVGSPDERSNP